MNTHICFTIVLIFCYECFTFHIKSIMDMRLSLFNGFYMGTGKTRRKIRCSSTTLRLCEDLMKKLLKQVINKEITIEEFKLLSAEIKETFK